MQISLSSLLLSRQIDEKKQFFENEVHNFIELHWGIQNIAPWQQEHILREKWTLAKFDTLLEILAYLHRNESNTVLTFPDEPTFEITPDIQEIRRTIFIRHNIEALFHKFIRPKARIDEAVNYGYSDYELSRVANLTMHSDEVHEKIQLFAEGDFLLVSKNHSQERLRRERKLGLDLIFTTLFKFGTLWVLSELQQHLTSKLDKKLHSELLNRTDTEYGSFHHVLYGMCSGNDDFVSPIWLNEKSEFSFLKLVVPLIKSLRNINRE